MATDFIPFDLKIHGLRIEFNNIECSSDKREPFEHEIPLEKKDMFLYLCENKSEFKPETILSKYFELKKNTYGFNAPMPYYYKFFVAINTQRNANKELTTLWQELNMDFFEYFLEIRNVVNADFILKPQYSF
jgi:hypothetical protein